MISSRRKVLFVDSAHPSLVERLSQLGFDCHTPMLASAESLREIVSNYEGIVIRSRFKLNAEILQDARQLRWIARVGAGMENIDLAYAQSKGIACLHAPEGNRNAVAEHSLGLLLNLMNKISIAHQEVKQGLWQREANRGFEIDGKTVAIIGYGNTGRAFAKKLTGFNCGLLALDKYAPAQPDDWAQPCHWDEVFEKADIVSLHLPYTAETHSLANDSFFNSFRKPIWFLNTSRGKICSTQALVNAIEAGKVLGAGLDVIEFEALSFESLEPAHPLLQKLLHLPQVIVTPHIGGWTHESKQKLADVLYHKISMLYQS